MLTEVGVLGSGMRSYCAIASQLASDRGSLPLPAASSRGHSEVSHMEDVLSLTEAARYLNVESTHLWRAAEEGGLKAERVKLEERDVWRFRKADLDNWRQTTSSSSVPTEVHLATLELVQQSQETIERLQRQMLQVQLAAAQGQRLLAEKNDAAFQERARFHAMEQKLASTETELKVLKRRAAQPWWRKIWSRSEEAVS